MELAAVWDYIFIVLYVNTVLFCYERTEFAYGASVSMSTISCCYPKRKNRRNKKNAIKNRRNKKNK